MSLARQRTLYHALNGPDVDVDAGVEMIASYVSPLVDLLARAERGERLVSSEVSMVLGVYRDGPPAGPVGPPVGKKICGIVTRKGKTCANAGLEQFGGRCGTHRARNAAAAATPLMGVVDDVASAIEAFDRENIDSELSRFS